MSICSYCQGAQDLDHFEGVGDHGSVVTGPCPACDGRGFNRAVRALGIGACSAKQAMDKAVEAVKNYLKREKERKKNGTQRKHQ